MKCNNSKTKNREENFQRKSKKQSIFLLITKIQQKLNYNKRKLQIIKNHHHHHQPHHNYMHKKCFFLIPQSANDLAKVRKLCIFNDPMRCTAYDKNHTNTTSYIRDNCLIQNTIKSILMPRITRRFVHWFVGNKINDNDEDSDFQFRAKVQVIYYKMHQETNKQKQTK